ncbi:hypothetical protein BY458DRAFT_524044 [Sporodiniella umbellata]|nr:hypothetical protein BY458DRAFT_524044 [Sporodiniella umbellata]
MVALFRPALFLFFGWFHYPNLLLLFDFVSRLFWVRFSSKKRALFLIQPKPFFLLVLTPSAPQDGLFLSWMFFFYSCTLTPILNGCPWMKKLPYQKVRQHSLS